MFKHIICILIAFFIAISPSFAIQDIQKGDVLNLEQCIDIALRNSPYVNKAKARIRLAEANVGGAKSAWTPAIGVGVGFNGSNSKEGHKSFSRRPQVFFRQIFWRRCNDISDDLWFWKNKFKHKSSKI